MHFLLTCIQHPVCSAIQPAGSVSSASQPAASEGKAAIRHFIEAWKVEKLSDDYQQRVEISKKVADE